MALKQASRSGIKDFDEEIKRLDFAQNLDEPLDDQKASGSNVTFLILYVDDIIIMGNHIPSLQTDSTESQHILRVECYCESGFETDRDDTKSQTGYVFHFEWRRSGFGRAPKQSTTAMSATEDLNTSDASSFLDNFSCSSYANEPEFSKGANTTKDDIIMFSRVLLVSWIRSAKYFDDTFEYRHVVLPPKVNTHGEEEDGESDKIRFLGSYCEKDDWGLLSSTVVKLPAR
ncbi:retrovirus-related pol polyprotein from transposon TNT 1-94 [Tanacetum coccineum]